MITAKNLISARFASSTASNEYTVPLSTRTIIDKFTATNTSGGAVTLNVYLVPSGDVAATSNLVISALSVAAGSASDITQLQNQILEAGDFLTISASVASALTIRASGREIT